MTVGIQGTMSTEAIAQMHFKRMWPQRHNSQYTRSSVKLLISLMRSERQRDKCRTRF